MISSFYIHTIVIDLNSTRVLPFCMETNPFITIWCACFLFFSCTVCDEWKSIDVRVKVASQREVGIFHRAGVSFYYNCHVSWQKKAFVIIKTQNDVCTR